MTNKKVIVIGGGPAGLMAAGKAAENAEVIILEKNNKIGRKLVITGKGRCNITNNCDVQAFISNVPTNPRFLYSAINNFTPQDAIAFFEENGLQVKTERGNRVFPMSDKAVDVADTLYKYVTNANCRIEKADVKSLIIEDNAVKGCVDTNGKKYYADSVIVACGGMSYPLTGSTGYGYVLARQAGHTVTEIKPSLVPLESEDSFCKDMQGLSLRNVQVSVVDNSSNKEIYSDFGELLFTHFGLSGPTVLSASTHMKKMQKGRYKVVIDLKPALSYEQLDMRIQRDFTKNINKAISNSLGELLPKKMIPVILLRWGISFDKKCNSITKQERSVLVHLMKNFDVLISGFRPVEEAIITSGGVKISEINPKTMESKLISGLYFAGEVIDVDGYTGGFNLQIAYSTGVLAGKNSSI